MVAAGRKIYGLLSEVLGRSLFKLTSSINPGDGGALWLAIKNKFCSTTAVSKLRVIINFITLTQGKTESIDDFFFGFSGVQAKFALMEITLKDTMLATFLKGLERRFDDARATLVMDSNMTLDEAKKKLLAYEDMKKLTTASPVGKALGAEAPSKACGFCGFHGHDIKVCYRKHGFPEGHRRFREKKGRGFSEKKEKIVFPPSRAKAKAVIAQARAAQWADPFAAESWEFGDKKALGVTSTMTPTIEHGLLHGYFDSGASHICVPLCAKPYLTNFRPQRTQIDGSKEHSTLKAVGVADLGIFKNVLVCDVSTFLLSESALRRQGFRITTQEPSGNKIIRDREFNLILTTKFNDTMWPVKVPLAPIYQTQLGRHKSSETANIFTTTSSTGKVSFLVGGKPANLAQAAHEKLGHIGYHAIKMMNEQGYFSPIIPKKDFDTVPVCDGCAAGKSVSATAPTSASRKATTVGEHCALDTVGPIKQKSAGGHKYSNIFACEFSEWSNVDCIKTKDGASMVESLKRLVSKFAGEESPKLISVIRRDGDPALNTAEFKEVVRELDAKLESTCAFSSHQNGRAERMIRRLVTLARTMVIAGRIPLRFWHEALEYACWVHNRVPSAAHNNKSPFEIRYCSKPDTSMARPFGARCWVHKLPNEIGRGNKFVQRAYGPPNERAAFLGISEDATGQKGYRVYIDKKGVQFIVRKSVTFDEGKTWNKHGLKARPGELRFEPLETPDTTGDSDDEKQIPAHGRRLRTAKCAWFLSPATTTSQTF